MEAAGIKTSESWSAYIQDVIKPNSQAMYLEGFRWESPEEMLIMNEYEQALIKNRVSVMAVYTAEGAQTIPLGTEGFESMAGSIPTQAARFVMDESEYRKQMAMAAKVNTIGGVGENAIMNTLFNSQSDMYNSHKNSMTYQRDSMVSSRKLELIEANNPRGIVGLTFDSGVPEENVVTLTSDKRWFTDSDKKVEGSTSDPVKDMKDMAKRLRMKGYDLSSYKIEADEISFYEDMEHSKWKIALGRNAYPTLVTDADGDAIAISVANEMGEAEIKRRFESIVGMPIELSNRIVAVEKFNKKTNKLERPTMRSFKANTYVFRPVGEIGTIKTVKPILPDSSDLYTTIFEGRGIMQYKYDSTHKRQDWWSELATLCVPNRPMEMYYLETK